MTYDDWKTRDDTPEPDPNRCEVCGHPETYFGGTKERAPAYCDCPCCNEPEEGTMRAEDTNGLAGQAVIDRFVEWVKELLQERDRLRDARSAYNAAADQVTHKRCENLEREIREEWQPRTERAELDRAVALLDRDAANAAALLLKSENESLNALVPDLTEERDALHAALHTTGVCPLLPGCWPPA